MESLLNFDALVEAVHGTCIGNQFCHAVFTSVVTDSRNCTKNSLFVPLMGTIQNGHMYIPQALKNGASVVFVNSYELNANIEFYRKYASDTDTAFIAVENTLTALQDSAACYVRKFPNLIKIGITGSSGKTTTKEILASVLSQKYAVVMNQGNLNSETGLPLSVFKIRKEHEVGIFEMGMNRRDEIKEIAGVLLPSIAIITNIGTAHIGILGTQDEIAEEKKQIFAKFSDKCVGFVPEMDPYLPFLQNIPHGHVMPFGIKSNARISDVSSSGLDGTVFEYDGQFIRFPVPGKHNFSNALAAIAVAEYLHMPVEAIKNGLESVKTIFGRSQVYRGDVTLVHDCYNANPDSMESALTFCDDLEWKGKRIYVLGDMLELGAQSCVEHNKIGRRAENSKADFILFFGKEMENAYDACRKSSKKKCFWSTDIEDIKNQLKSAVCKGDLLILKASKGMALWRAAEVIGLDLGGEK